jgi:GntR family transcriptional regulator, transcriptional repressor for pyruvate dehydrogenase complex
MPLRSSGAKSYFQLFAAKIRSKIAPSGRLLLIRPVKLADAIADHLEKLILEGVLRPGEKLAPERELAEKLEVSRPSLSEALNRLAAKGLIETTKAGTTVAQFLSPLARPLADLLADKPRVTADYFEYRRIVEAQAAALAARRATEVDREALRSSCARMREAHKRDDPAEEARADADLHQSIYEAAHNVVLMHVMRVFGELARNNVFFNREQLYGWPGVRDRLLEQHLSIAEAILAGDARAAEQAAADHIGFVFQTIEDMRRDERRTEAALRRITRSDLLAD